MICIYRQKKYGAHFCLRCAENPEHCGALRAVSCAVKDTLGAALASMAARLRRAAR